MGAIKSVIVSVSILGMLMFNIFCPYYLINVFPVDGQKILLGIHYRFTTTSNIAADFQHINDTGFKVIKIWMQYSSDLASETYNETFNFFQIRQLYPNIKIAVIVKDTDISNLNNFLTYFGSGVDYIQMLNEPETSSSWAPGAVLTDDMIKSDVEDIWNITQLHIKSDNLTIQTYVNFGAGFLLRPNLVDLVKNYTNFIGYDTYMDGVVQVTPFITELLNKFSGGKSTVISEFGVSENDDNAQAADIINNLNFFKNEGFSQVWLVYWNSATTDAFNIANRQSQTAIKQWITQQNS